MILRNKCNVSGITLEIGTEGNMGAVLQLNRVLLDLAFWEHSMISSTVRAPLLISVIDHSLVISERSNFGHLHQRQENSEAKPPIPVI